MDVWRARRPHTVGVREAAAWSAVYVGVAGLFGLGVLLFAGPGPALEFTTGYLVEKMLSVDNLFVFALVLGAFAVPARHQAKVLLIGILGALGMRIVFILAGAAALSRFSVLFLGFGALLVYTAVRLLRSHGDAAGRAQRAGAALGAAPPPGRRRQMPRTAAGRC